MLSLLCAVKGSCSITERGVESQEENPAVFFSRMGERKKFHSGLEPGIRFEQHDGWLRGRAGKSFWGGGGERAFARGQQFFR